MSPKHTYILVVADESEVLFALKLLLKSEGREVVTEKNPKWLRLLLHQHFALVLLDLNYRCCARPGNLLVRLATARRVRSLFYP